MAKYHMEHKRSTRRILLLITGMLALVIVGSGIYAQRLYTSNLKPLSASQVSQVITIPSGSTVKQIGDQLQEKAVIRKSWAFQWYVRNSDLRDQLQAGSYALKPSLSVSEVVDIIAKGNIATDLVTILPGKRIDEIRDKLINDGFAVDDVDAALKPEQYEGHPALVDKPRDASLEGYLYPETFQRTGTTKASDIIAASLDQMQTYLTPDLRAGIVKQGLTVHQGIILASIVEGEVPEPENRPLVAQVFLRRLNIGMKLESNATDKISSIQGDQYNTYKIAALPPGPISNVTETALKAVANPSATDWLFFVTGEDCVTRFGRTNDDHLANIESHGVRTASTKCPQ